MYVGIFEMFCFCNTNLRGTLVWHFRASTATIENKTFLSAKNFGYLHGFYRIVWMYFWYF